MASTANPEAQNMDDVSILISSHYRHDVAEALLDGPKTPSKIEAFHDGEVDIAHASRALKELCEEGLVELMVSEDRQKGRIYGLTDAGRDAAEYAVQM